MRFIRWVKSLFAPKPIPVPQPSPKPEPCLADQLCDDHERDVKDPAKPDVSEWTPAIYRQEYLDNWNSMTVNLIGKQSKGTIDWTVSYILRHKERYVKASELIMERLNKFVPWQLIGVLHMREASGNFTKQIMNGQPFTQRTTWVPKGYGPWRNWEESCVDAFRIKQMPPSWNIVDTLYFAERFNGMGYRTETRRRIVGFSPYIWAYTNHYKGGYFVSDGKFSATAIAMGVGVALLLRELKFQGE